MCGIVALLSRTNNNFYYPDVDVFQELLIVNSLRGSDGTGITGVYDSGNAFIYKVGSHPYALITHPDWPSIRSRMYRNCAAIIGHNRKATVGKISNETSHPFHEKHIILSHNGNIINFREFENTEVDSHALAHLFATTPIEEAIPKIQGAFAMIWYDMKEKKVHFVRNEDRPLCIIQTKDFWIVSSEMGNVQWVCARNLSQTIQERTIIPPHDLYTWDIKTRNIEIKKVGKYTYTPKVFPSYLSNEDKMPLPNIVSEEIPIRLPDNRVGRDAISTDFAERFKQRFFAGRQVTFKKEPVEIWTSSGITGMRVYGKDEWDGLDVEYKENVLSVERRELLQQAEYVTGNINSVVMTSKKITCWMSSLAPAITVTTYNNTTLPRSVWVTICNSNKCQRCEGIIIPKDVPLVSLSLVNENVKRIFCAKCVLNAYRKNDDEVKKRIDKWSPVNIEKIAQELGLA